ncbi:SAM-dependent DNA methyltransferase [Phormidesmis priestleyi ULC007]|uniref:site-specific DNA-methyltransferase (adenine-specific) n=1 Tax=Phormidesmis priestleyi ULC007 TaxID=1920490 RepID=A0A2T1DAJ2_9CYAN|nr:class I SAM-dependent DNA methyltransferase [Phormidesmis priestleyi]PSB17528.1 SAM-dependent DNA methyltransferase [Phormidesmis priestleyi ULC007]
MAKRTTSSNSKPQTTAQRLGSVIKSARDIMRKDKGLNGELDRLPQLTWILFLKLLDDVERIREEEAVLAGTIAKYKPTIEPPYRWRDWASHDEGISGEELQRFISNDEATLRDGTKCLGLFPYLRGLQSKTGRDRQDIIREVFRGISNRMESGALLRDVVNKVNEIHFDKSEEVSILSDFYESMLKEMRDAAGDSGEFYTPRAVVAFMVKAIAPQVGETIHDPACGTAGFLVAAYKYLREKCQPKDWKILQSSLSGIEAKSLPLMLAQMNLLLNGVEYPDVERKNSLGTPINQIGVKDQVDVILTNPPFGGEEEAKIKDNFDPKMQTAETALLFLQLIMRLLKSRSGRAGIVVPNGTLFGDGVSAKIKEKLLTEYNLHTIVRLPNGVFAPYTSIPTNLLFFDASGATEEIWYYEVPLPEGRKSFSKTKPMQESDFDGCFAWWNDRTENTQAWKYDFKAAYDKAKSEAQPHWDAARKAEANANRNAKRVKELETQIQNINASLLDFASVKQQAKVKQEIQDLKEEQKQTQVEERQEREIAKQKQTKGDSLYWWLEG